MPIFKIATGRLPDKYEGCQILRQTSLKKKIWGYYHIWSNSFLKGKHLFWGYILMNGLCKWINIYHNLTSIICRTTQSKPPNKENFWCGSADRWHGSLHSTNARMLIQTQKYNKKLFITPRKKLPGKENPPLKLTFDCETP